MKDFTMKIKPHKKTNKEKALEALQAAGDKGVHSYDMRDIAGIQAPVRIWELIHNDGHDIITRSEKRGNSIGVRYFIK